MQDRRIKAGLTDSDSLLVAKSLTPSAQQARLPTCVKSAVKILRTVDIGKDGPFHLSVTFAACWEIKYQDSQGNDR